MPGPAARMGDPTAHGGTIAIGFPMVVIGGMPAARLTDMHVCPMVTPATPPIPHVGGPISGPGVPTVLIGNMPAATLGDMLVCVGPPDVVAMGCPTVIIGTGGGGAGSAGSAGGGGGGGATASANVAAFDNNEAVTKEEHWVEFAFVDKAGNAVSGVPYAFKGPDGETSTGALRLDGRIRRSALESAGKCEVTLYGVSGAKWDLTSATKGDKLQLTAKTVGFDDGTPAQIQIFQRDLRTADLRVAHLKAKVQGGEIRTTWRHEYPEPPAEEDASHLRRTDATARRYSSPTYYFEVVVGSCHTRSPLLDVSDSIEIELADEAGEPIANVPYRLVSASGEVRTGTLDGSGFALVEKIPPGDVSIKFIELPDLDPTETDFDPMTAGAGAGAGGGAGASGGGGAEQEVARFQVFDARGEPMAGVEYILRLGGREVQGTTDRSGWTEEVELQGETEAELEVERTVHRLELQSSA